MDGRGHRDVQRAVLWGPDPSDLSKGGALRSVTPSSPPSPDLPLKSSSRLPWSRVWHRISDWHCLGRGEVHNALFLPPGLCTTGEDRQRMLGLWSADPWPEGWKPLRDHKSQHAWLGTCLARDSLSILPSYTAHHPQTQRVREPREQWAGNS